MDEITTNMEPNGGGSAKDKPDEKNVALEDNNPVEVGQFVLNLS